MAEINSILQSNIAPVGPSTDRAVQRGGDKAGPSFQSTLSSLAQPAVAPPPQKVPSSLKFSSHAVERMQSRGISYSPEQLARIDSAVEKAAAKGGKSTLLLTGDSAMIVSVDKRTVVTVMDKNALKENVFTNIDSTVVI